MREREVKEEGWGRGIFKNYGGGGKK